MRHATCEQQSMAGARSARVLRRAYGVAALNGRAIGVVWTIAGLLHFHPLW